jgi:hypothetical protein
MVLFFVQGLASVPQSMLYHRTRSRVCATQYLVSSYEVSCLRHTVPCIIVRSLVSVPPSTLYHRTKYRVCATQYLVSS